MVDNPYGLEALWKGGDLVARITLGILVIMSMGSWYIIITKVYEQFRMGKHAEALTLWECAAEVARLAAAAREGKATRDELSGSTISITSLGVLGGVATTPVINYPEVAIVGVPDLLWGEIGVAVCVLRPNAPLNEHELLAWLAPKVARYKLPRRVFFWNELPRSGYGKITKKIIRAELDAFAKDFA